VFLYEKARIAKLKYNEIQFDDHGKIIKHQDIHHIQNETSVNHQSSYSKPSMPIEPQYA